MNDTTTATGTANTGTSADAIERDIEHTQNQISNTVEQLQRRLNPRAIVDAVLGDDDQAGQQLVTAARNNPLAVGLIGLGALLLASGKTPSLGGLTGNRNTDSDDRSQRPMTMRWGRGGQDHHVSYIEHMAKVEQREGEDDVAYSRRRDIARANYFMLDQHHDEDDGSFRTRLNEAQAALRSKTSAFGDKARRAMHDGRDGVTSAGSAVSERSKAAYSQVSDWTDKARSSAMTQYDSNPAVGGLIAAAIGAVVGAALPPSEIERQQLGSVGEKARDMIASQKDKLVQKADSLLDASGGAGSTGGASGEAASVDYAGADEPTRTQA